MLARAGAWLALVVGASTIGCFGDVRYGCDDTQQCQVGSAQGFCEANGECSYVDDACDSGRRYGPFASETRAGSCVEGDAATEAMTSTAVPTTTGIVTSGSTNPDPSSTTASSSGGRESSSSGCSGAECLAAGDERWSAGADAPVGSQARAVAASEGMLIVSGRLGSDAPPRLLLRQYATNDGAALGQVAAARGRAFTGDAVEHMPDAGFVVAGSGPSPVGGLRAEILRFDARGALLWSDAVDTGRDDAIVGLAVFESLVVAAGNSGDDAWTRVYTDEGVAPPPTIHRPPAEPGEVPTGRWSAAARHGNAVWLAGSATLDGQEQVWVRRVTAAGALEIELVHPPLVRALAVSAVGSLDALVGGTSNGDAWSGRVNTRGAFEQTSTIDEADALLDVASTPEGGWVAVGTSGDDGWVRRFDPQGAQLWSATQTDARFGAVAIGETDAFVVGQGSDSSLLVRAYAL